MLTKELTKSILRTNDNYINALAKAGVKTIGDLLKHYPRDYEDRTNVLDNFSLINLKEKNTILVKLISLDAKKTANGKLLTKGVIEDKNGFLAEAVWFNRKYLTTQLSPFKGSKVLLSGKVKYNFGKVTFNSPEVETDLSKVSGEIVPIYSDLNYIPTKWISNKIELIKSYIENIDEDLPHEIIKKYGFISKKQAVYKVHFPANKHDIEIAKYRLAYGELYDINYRAISSKYEGFKHTEGRSIGIKMNPDTVKHILSHIGFTLTDHQKITLFQILKDMEKNHSMQRLLEGDVGTGKTIVAVIALIHSVLETRGVQPSPPTPLLGRRGEEAELINKTPPLIPPLSGEGENTSGGGSLDEVGSSNQLSVENKSLNEDISGDERKSTIRQNYGESRKYVVDLAKNLRKEGTKSEKILWNFLRNKKLAGIKFRRQHPFGRYIADFYCSEYKCVIEIDGKIHEQQEEYDKIREEIIKTYGVKILRIKNEEISNDIIKTLEKISAFLSPGRGKYPEGDRGNKSIQVAIMAPTEILARQHFEGIQELLMKFSISSHLLVGSLTAKQKKEVKTDIKQGNIDVVIGTHALVQEDVIFNNLGFVVVDEQHRFGVKQREVLEKGLGNRSGVIPHNLNMTATPIPRTLALTLYGDQDLSIISQYPKGRKQIFTKVAKNDAEREQIELFVRAEIEKGRQVFWISPLVEESEKIDLANAINTYETLQAIFEPFKVGLLHGKMKAKEKDEIMKDFKDNKIQILSSTSVVEVGVDIPNSTIMCIEGAERFGLSQLHQFRGRVGRGSHQSYCYLFPSKGNYTDRLKAMERTNNGFELAEIDLELRGPGEVYGLRQSGIPDLKIADLKDLELISQIREDIEELFDKKDN